MARFIRDGGLVLPEGWSQVDPSSFALLADINTEGMLTADSQDAIDPHPVQRAYVSGFMLPAHAAQFIRWLNMHTDKVAFVLTSLYSVNCVGYKAMPGITVTKTLDGQSFTAIPPVIVDSWDRMAHEMRVSYGVLPRKDLVQVECFDPVWGRSAVSTDGLFHAVVNALKQSRIPTSSKKRVGRRHGG